ncbi:MAG: RNA 2'-phosphotransferase, partial [Amphritea sp.]
QETYYEHSSPTANPNRANDMDKQLTRVSKYLSYLLRHNPDAIGIRLDEKGWASIEELIEKKQGFSLSRELIEVVVETNDKQRFAISPDGARIRANQGHSLNVDLDLCSTEPPETLIHGTAERFWSSIERKGLLKGDRHHVHLTESLEVAMAVGGRYGKPVILKVAAQRMHDDGYKFYKSANNVWLVEHVPVSYIRKA